jgi:hypothetical protein
MIVKRLPRFLLLGLILTVLGLPGLALASQPATSHTVPLTPTDVLSVTLSPSADNTLYEDPNGSLSNGAGAYFFAGRAGMTANGAIRRGLIRFDVASSLPPTATIVSATLYLTMSQTVAGPQSVELHRVTASWGEGGSAATGGEGSGAPAAAGDATWLHRFYSSTLWTKPGGDFAATASATTTVNGIGLYSWSAPGMVSDVRVWLDAPATNEGWLLLGNETTSSTAKRFDTKENPVPNARPLLVVTYLLLPHKTYLPIVSKQ